MKMNRITMMGILAALALIMAPGFTAQAAPVDPLGTSPPQVVGPDTSPDVAGTAGDIETPDVGVEAEVEVPEIEDIEVAEIETPDIEAPEVEAPEVETPELGE